MKPLTTSTTEPTMIEIHLQLDREIVRFLSQLAQEQGRSQDELIHDALLMYTQQVTRPKPKGIGRYHSGRSDVSECAEEFLRKAAQEAKYGTDS